MQLNLRVAKSEGADARSIAEEATSSYNSIKAEYGTAQTQAKQAAEAAAAEISSLQASIQCIFLPCLCPDAAKCRQHSHVTCAYCFTVT